MVESGKQKLIRKRAHGKGEDCSSTAKIDGKEEIVLPTSKRNEVLRGLHLRVCGSHFEVKKTLEKLWSHCDDITLCTYKEFFYASYLADFTALPSVYTKIVFTAWKGSFFHPCRRAVE